MPIIEDVAADKSTYKPGEAAQITVTISNAGAAFEGRLTLTVTHIDAVVSVAEQAVEISAGAMSDFSFSLTPPETALRGYGLDATLYAADGQVVTEGSGALDVLERWSQAPRYGFLADFAAGDGEKTGRFDSLRRYHLNVVQFYDWMWRHYKLLPPSADFTDALGRALSLDSVEQAIRAVQGNGAAAMAYGAVYAAEPEYALEHPDLMLYDEERKPISLAELFYIMNIAEGSPFVPLVVDEFAATVRALDFDGIHLDQYGFPKDAWTLDGGKVHLADDFPGLINAARAAVVAAKPDAGVIFNAVTNWPIERVAPTDEDVVYIEVWTPYDSYNDLRDLIRDAKRLGGGKAVILAAYLAPFAEATTESLPQAEAAAFLSSAVIAASGGFHLLLGENEGLLCDPYYVKYATMRPAFAADMRRYYDFLVRHQELLTAPEIADAPDVCLSAQDAPLSMTAQAGVVWAMARRTPGYTIVHLINLTGQSDTNWNALRTPVAELVDIELTISGLESVGKVFLLSPDENMGRAQQLSSTEADGGVRVTLPCLRVWSMVVIADAA